MLLGGLGGVGIIFVVFWGGFAQPSEPVLDQPDLCKQGKYQEASECVKSYVVRFSIRLIDHMGRRLHEMSTIFRAMCFEKQRYMLGKIRFAVFRLNS